MIKHYENIKVILVEPLGPINVGSIARICENFGIKEIRIVSPKCDLLDLKVKKMALKGMSLIKNAKCYLTLVDAIADCNRVVATCGRIDHGEIPLYSTETTLNWLIDGNPKNIIGIVFGREDRGLTNQELLLAQKVLTINTSPSYPSLNLSHAVAIVLYELSKCIGNCSKVNNHSNNNPAKPKELNDLIDASQEFLIQIGFLYKHTALAKMQKIKSMLQRAEARSEEIALLRGILSQAKWFINKKND